MSVQVLNRFSGEVIASGESVRTIVLSNRADLHGAYLHGADLYGADLHGADLHGALGLIHIQHRGFDLWVQAKKTKIGCLYLENSKLLKITEGAAVRLGIEAKNYEAYRVLLRAGIKALKIEG